MTRTCRFVARCNCEEKELLQLVAEALQRTPSDTLRILVYEKARALEIRDQATSATVHRYRSGSDL